MIAKSTLDVSERRRQLLKAAALACVPVPLIARAQDKYPTRPIRIIVPFAPGGAADSSARLVGGQWTRLLKQQVVVENRPGASGNIGAQFVARAEPDGYTLLLGFDGTMVINPFVFNNIPFNTVKDFAPVGKIGNVGLLMVANPKLSVTSLSDVIELSKQQPNGLSIGSTGTGSTAHLLIELLKQETGANLVHIPYKGAGPAMIAAMGGETPLAVIGLAGTPQQINSGGLRGIAVSSAKRFKLLPQVPTMVESGLPDLVMNSWNGLLAPAGTSRSVIDLLNSALNKALQEESVLSSLEGLGFTATPGTPEAFSAEIQKDLERYGSIVKATNIRVGT